MSQATAAYRMHWVSKTGRKDWCETPLSALINDSDEEDPPIIANATCQDFARGRRKSRSLFFLNGFPVRQKPFPVPLI
ncbi:hypothetical protein ABIE63_003380 [Limibacillus sp. MBR-115]|jgi:hypothetical protein